MPTLTIGFKTLDRGTHSGIRDQRALVIRDWAIWDALWKEHTAGRLPPPPLPTVDFSREMVVAFFLGEKPTSGYAVEIREVLLTEAELRVRVEVTVPQKGAIVLQILTQPFHIICLPQHEGPVRFEVVQKLSHVRGCGQLVRDPSLGDYSGMGD